MRSAIGPREFAETMDGKTSKNTSGVNKFATTNNRTLGGGTTTDASTGHKVSEVEMIKDHLMVQIKANGYPKNNYHTSVIYNGSINLKIEPPLLFRSYHILPPCDSIIFLEI